MNKAENQAGMNNPIREDLSAGVDGQLSKEELRFLLRRLDHDASLQQAWARYHVARDGLRRELPTLASADFAERVMLAIEQQAMPSVTRRGHWLRWSAGGAIAASVAAAALMVGQPTADVERTAMPSAHRAVAAVSPTATTTASQTLPATVPPWLSGNSAGLLSQQASATLGAPLSNSPSNYVQGLSGFPHRYRMLDKKDGSYLLLLGPAQQTTPDMPRQLRANAQ
jgi:sigma-E factor negative regulatory protein RseA